MRVLDIGTCGALALATYAINASLFFEVPFHGLFRTSMYSENSNFSEYMEVMKLRPCGKLRNPNAQTKLFKIV